MLAAASCSQSNHLPQLLFLSVSCVISGIQASAWRPEVPTLHNRCHNRCTAQVVVRSCIACQHTLTKVKICCSCRSDIGSGWTGGQEEALMHYEDAMTAVFSLQLNSHRHVQPYRSKKDGRIKWATFEMWPMSVSPHLIFLVCLCMHVICNTCIDSMVGHLSAQRLCVLSL